MDKLIKHSLTDWEFSVARRPYIVATQYVSPPTSIAGTYIAGQQKYGWFFLKEALAADLPEGRMVSWFRRHTGEGGLMRWYFRTQALPDGPTDYPANCYYYWETKTYGTIYRRVADSDTILASDPFPSPYSIDEWVHERLTFFQYVNVALQNVLRIIFEREIAGEWVEQISADDPANYWAESGTNRIGFYLRPYSNTSHTWMDDTEIWRKI